MTSARTPNNDRTPRRMSFPSFRGARGKMIVSAAAAVALLVAVASALGFFTNTGSAHGTPVSSGSLSAVTISPASPTTQLYPGGSADVAATVDNPNSIPVHLPSLVLDTSQGGGTGFAVSNAPGCSVADADLTFHGPQTNGPDDFVVPAKSGGNDGSLPLDLADAVSVGADAVKTCQGATFTVYLKVGS